MNKSIAAIAAASMLFTACETRKTTRVEVTPQMCWHVHDYAGSIGSADYHNITNYWVTNCYAPFVVSQGTPFTMDFVEGSGLGNWYQCEEVVSGLPVSSGPCHYVISL